MLLGRLETPAQPGQALPVSDLELPTEPGFPAATVLLAAATGADAASRSVDDDATADPALPAGNRLPADGNTLPPATPPPVAAIVLPGAPPTEGPVLMPPPAPETSLRPVPEAQRRVISNASPAIRDLPPATSPVRPPAEPAGAALIDMALARTVPEAPHTALTRVGAEVETGRQLALDAHRAAERLATALRLPPQPTEVHRGLRRSTPVGSMPVAPEAATRGDQGAAVGPQVAQPGPAVGVAIRHGIEQQPQAAARPAAQAVTGSIAPAAHPMPADAVAPAVTTTSQPVALVAVTATAAPATTTGDEPFGKPFGEPPAPADPQTLASRQLQRPAPRQDQLAVARGNQVTAVRIRAPGVPGGEPIERSGAKVSSRGEAEAPTTAAGLSDGAGRADFRLAPSRAELVPADVLSQVARHIVAAHSQRLAANHLRLKLHPEDLGQLEVKLRLDGDRLHVGIVVQHGAARELLQDNLTSLRALLADQGLDLGDVDVRQHDSGQRAGPDGARDGGRRAADGADPTISAAAGHHPDSQRLIDAFV